MEEKIILNIKTDLNEAINGINVLMYLNDLGIYYDTSEDEHAVTFDYLLTIRNDIESIIDRLK